MIRLDTFQRKLQAVLGGAVTTSQPTAIVCYTDIENENQKKFFIEAQTSTLNNATPVDILAAPDKAMVREVDSIHIRNNDTVAATVTVRINDNGTNYELVEVTIQAGETLVYTDSEGWKVITDYGNTASVFGYVDFDTNANPAVQEGRLFWDSGDGSLTLGLKGGNSALQLGQENVALCYNDSGSTITNGSVVAVSGAQGQRPKIVLADADSEPFSAATLGIATEDIANGAEGFVCTFGLVRGIDTSTFVAGNPIYLSQTAGKFTSTRPLAPAHTVFLGWIIKVNANSGEVFVHISNGWELEELHNVLISSPSDGQVLTYDSGLWKNLSSAVGVSSFSAGTTGFTPSVATTGAVTLSGTLDVDNGGTGITSGTSGGIPYFSAATTIASSAALAANALVVGGGAGVAPSTVTTGNGVLTALGVNTGTAGAFVVNGGALGTPSSGTVTNLTGTASININGTVGATTPTTGAFTTLSASGVATFSAGTASAPAITTSGDTNNGIFFPAADATAITTAGTERLRVDASGNVGIGTTSAGEKLHVVGAITTGGQAAANKTSAGTFDFYATNNATRILSWGSTGVGGKISFWTGSGGSGTTQQAVIDSSGNVGIGTSTPTAKTHIYGAGSTSATPSTSSSLGSTIALQDSGAASGNGGMVMFGANQGFFAAIKGFITDGANNTRGRIYFCTRNATTDSTLTDRLTIFEDGKIYALGVYTNTVGATNRDVYVDNAGLLGYVSSIRSSKTNISDITDVSWLYQLNPVSYQYRKKDADGNFTNEADGPIGFGLIAEDTEPVKPELCFYDIVDGKQELRGISYSKLIVPMLKAIQEQQQQIDALKAEVAAIKGN